MRNLMRGVARLLLHLLGSDERGVVGVLVALLLGGGVLTGLGALVIDVGQLYQNRAELQNGADAAALAVAKSCATGTCTPTLATQYANENASELTGNTAAVGVVCGSGTLGACPVSSGSLDCPAAPAAGQQGYVDVHTSTKLANGTTILPASFAKTLLGNSSYTGTTVQACSQAAWGGVPSNMLSTAFTISACEWDKATTSGTVYAQPPPSTPSTTLDRQIKLRNSGAGGGGCTNYPSPADAVSKYGWITETGGCTLQIAGPTYSVLNATPSPNCNTPLFDDAQNAQNHAVGSWIYVPVYTSVTGTSPNFVYNLKGIAGFVVTGYNIPGGSNNFYSDWLKSSNNCSGGTYCINGYFVQALLPVSGAFGAANLGLGMIKVTG
jgi:Flp pilus assembly protein TadG